MCSRDCEGMALGCKKTFDVERLVLDVRNNSTTRTRKCTERLFYRGHAQRSCSGMSRRMQVFCTSGRARGETINERSCIN